MAKKKSGEIAFDPRQADSILNAMLARKDEYRKKTLRELFAPLLLKVRALSEAGVELAVIAEHLSENPATRITASQLKTLLAAPKPIKGAKANPASAQRPAIHETSENSPVV